MWYCSEYLDRLLDLQETHQRIKPNKSCRDIPTQSQQQYNQQNDYQNNQQLQL